MKLKIFISVVLMIAGMISLKESIGPPPAIGPYLNGIFPERSPGVQGSWSLEDPLEGTSIISPLRIIPFGQSSHELLILSKAGEVYLLNKLTKSVQRVLDISDRTMKLGDAGSVGIALHPNFDGLTERRVFIYYRTTPMPEDWNEDGFNRLSAFEWDNQIGQFRSDSENILIQQYDRSTWHNGGALLFGPDGYLYISVGDEGIVEHIDDSTQRLNGGFFSGILRIDIDNDLTRSHSIRRQPQPNLFVPESFGRTFSQGYTIPNDNPWQSENGDILEEFYALGVRSPYTMSYDTERDVIWLADVGSSVAEEIDIIKKGHNYQWPYVEGATPSETKVRPADEDYFGTEESAYYVVDRNLGACIIGGTIYDKNKFPYLNGKYLFADFISNKLMALTYTGEGNAPEVEVLIADVRSAFSNLPEKGGVTGVFVLEDGNIWLSYMGEDFSRPGKILQLTYDTPVAEPPAQLSDLGVFTNLNNLTPIDGIMPYDVNAPLYSDGATKQRWMSIPNDGTVNQDNEKIIFSEEDEWQFPEGTVFIKQFDLPINADGDIKRLETRFLVIGKDQTAYGLTYKWNDEGTDAILLGGGSTKDFVVTDAQQNSYIQTWDYPSRDQCMTCHNFAAKHVLGVKTHQLNKSIYYPELNAEMNQIDYLRDVGFLDDATRNVSTYLKSEKIDNPDEDLEWRIRSYLDANCASCHRQGGLNDVYIDFRLKNNLALQQYFNAEPASHASSGLYPIIKPGDHAASEIWIRDASEGTNKMPPLGRNFVDQVYVDSLAKWIDNVKEDDLIFDHDVIVYPNPTTDWAVIRINESWEAPFQIYVRTVSGRLVQQQTKESNFIHVNLSNYPQGNYFITIISGDRRQTKKVIKY